MSVKLEKLGADREKARKKRDEWDNRYKDLDRKYKAQENAEIQETVHAYNLTPAQLAELLKNMKAGTANVTIELPGTEEMEEKTDEAKE